ncbi:MAG: HNH endonuclease [Gammaproteobacteria bacterium]|nr:HNH endonuclease [Gammaproteobacteria bacterium]
MTVAGNNCFQTRDARIRAAAFAWLGEQVTLHGDVLPRAVLAEGFQFDGALRFAMERRLPLVYIHGVVPGKYLITWPVFVIEDDPQNLTFSVAVDDAQHLGLPDTTGSLLGVREEADAARRSYVTAAVRVRLHQRAFRERVLEAYRRQCAFCRLRHEELLDAAHIVPDTEPRGEPVVRNGLALCTLHHAAFQSAESPRCRGCSSWRRRMRRG